MDPPPGLHVGAQKSRLAGVIRQTDGIQELLNKDNSLKLLNVDMVLLIKLTVSNYSPVQTLH